MMRSGFLSSLQKLNAGSEDFEQLVSKLSFGVFVDQVELGCIYANDESLRIFGMDWQEFQGFGWANAVLPEDMEVLREAIQRYEIEQTWIDVQYRIDVPGGSTRAIHVLGNWFKAFNRRGFENQYPDLNDYIPRIARIPAVRDYILNLQEPTTWFPLPDVALKLTSTQDLEGLVNLSWRRKSGKSWGIDLLGLW